jgi:hypothetical protein
MKIASTRVPGLAFKCTIAIEAISLDGLTKKHIFTTRPITAWSDLRERVRLAGDEARRLEVEPVLRSVKA